MYPHHSLTPARTAFSLALLLIALMALSRPAAAVELIPMLGYSSGGSFEDVSSGERTKLKDAASFGLIAAWDSEPNKQYELLYSYQNSALKDDLGLTPSATLFDIQIHHLQFGGNYFFNGRKEPIAPYVAGGLGLSLLDPKVDQASTLVRPSINLALGLQWQPSEALGLRLELRGVGILMHNRSSISCGVGCNVRVAGDLLTQLQLNTGLVVRF